MAEVNYDLLSTKDLQAITEDRWDDVSTAALKYIAGEEVGAWEAFSTNAERAVKSSLETITGWFGANASEEDKANIQQQESEARIAAETNPVAGITGQIVGSILDPVTLPAAVLKPLKIAGSAFKTGALRGSAAGTVGGALQPVFEEFGDTRTMNIAAGAALGGGIGGAAGTILRKFGIDISLDPAEMKAKVDTLPPDQKEQLLLEWNGVYEKLPTEEKTKLLEWNGKTTPLEPALATPTKPVEWNPTLKSLETVEEAPSTLDLSLPTQLKRPVKINKVTTEFADDLDHAFWQVAQNKGVQSQASMSWLMDKTGLAQREIQGIAKRVQAELAKRMGTMTPDKTGKMKFDTPSMLGNLIKQRIAPPRVVRTPYQPTRIDVKTELDSDDIQRLRLTGVIVTQNKNGEVRFRDSLAPRQPFLNAAELKARLNAVGIDLDVPGYREKIKAAQAVPKEEVTKIAQEAPVIKQAEAVQQAGDISRTPYPEKVTIPKAKDVASNIDMPEDIGIPKAYGSVGSAGVDPKTLGAEDLMPKTYGDIIKGGETRDRVLMRMLETDDPRVAVPKDIAATVKNKGTLLAFKQKARARLQEIIKDHGNFVNYMLSQTNQKAGMPAEDVAAFQWFHADAMANKVKIVNDLVEMRKRGESFDSPRAAEMARDLVYYTGVDMFWKNEGTKASRALNARRLIQQYGNKKVKTIFPGADC